MKLTVYINTFVNIQSILQLYPQYVQIMLQYDWKNGKICLQTHTFTIYIV